MAGMGTGYPLSFRCGRCRSTVSGAHPAAGWIDRITLTGRVRSASNKGNLHSRTSTDRREYTCKDCGHVGWSNHDDLAELAGSEAPTESV